MRSIALKSADLTQKCHTYFYIAYVYRIEFSFAKHFLLTIVFDFSISLVCVLL